jgi:hypothetical protein
MARLVFLPMSVELLPHYLRLPPEVRCKDARVALAPHGGRELELLLEGECFPEVLEGHIAPRYAAVYETQEDGTPQFQKFKGA